MRTIVACVAVSALAVGACASSSDHGAKGGNQALSGDPNSVAGGAAHASPTCTAQSSVRGDVELQSKPLSSQGKTGVVLTVKDQTKAPYFLSITIDDGSNDVTIVLTDLTTNQSSGFDGGFASNGKLDATLMIRNPAGDDIVQVSCQK
jgi:hypothetical protein